MLKTIVKYFPHLKNFPQSCHHALQAVELAGIKSQHFCYQPINQTRRIWIKLNTEAQFLGELSPLLSQKHGKMPDRRQVSLRWLISSVLVGLTSVALMGGALFAALEGREQLATPAKFMKRTLSNPNEISFAQKGNHPGLINKIKSKDSNVMMVSTVSRVDGTNVVKVRPFLNINSVMALAPKPSNKYPAFNALDVFSETGKSELVAKNSDFMYGADVEGEVNFNVVAFPYNEAEKSYKPRQQGSEIERQVRAMSANIDNNLPAVSALSYFDSERFSFHDQPFIASPDVTITAENVSVLSRSKAGKYDGVNYDERLIEVRADAKISEIFAAEGLHITEAQLIEQVLASDLGTPLLKTGDQLQTYFSTIGNQEDHTRSLARVSLFRGTTHMVSIARTDNNRFVYAIPPESPEEILDEAEKQRIIAGATLPSVYDGIYRTALSQGITPELAGVLVKVFAFDVDFKNQITADDSLSVFVSLEEGQEKPTAESEILHASIRLNGIRA